MASSSLSDRIKARIAQHNRYMVEASGLSMKYLRQQDYAEAARWSDVARSHRHVVEVLKGLVGA